MNANGAIVSIILGVFLTITALVYLDAEKEKEFAKVGLEECVVTSGGYTKTIWVKDCNTTKVLYK